jgi:hypothetical protein
MSFVYFLPVFFFFFFGSIGVGFTLTRQAFYCLSTPPALFALAIYLFAVLATEFRAYTLSHTTSPFL